MTRLLPVVLAVLNALFLYFPYVDRLVGLGDDPLFNLWTLEHDWKVISGLGPWTLFLEKGWNAPIFYPFPLSLALSECQVYLAILTWPLRILSGNGTWTLNVTALLMNLAAFLFGALWLRSVGVTRLYAWGGLLFAMSGWVQSHSAHYQNICVFLLPLALWLWSRFVREPSLSRAVAAAVGFGWIIGWNVYFQTFANLMLVSLALYEGWKRPNLRRSCAAVVVAAALIELPLARLYLSSRKLLGNAGVSLEDFSSASLLAFLYHYYPTTLVSWLLPFYPTRSGNVEPAGFVGFTWMALALWACVSVKTRRLRLLALAAFAFYWISLGPSFLLHHAVSLFPGVGELRAVGRFQLLFTLLSLAPILLLLESRSRTGGGALLALIFLELIPAKLPGNVGVPRSYFAGPSEFTQVLAKEGPAEPVLAFPFGVRRFQLYGLQGGNPILDGYSGRFPEVYHLLERSLHDWGEGEDRLRAVMSVTGARLWVSLDQPSYDRLERVSFLRAKGCYSHVDLRPCLFVVDPEVFRSRPEPLRVERDLEWRYGREGDWHTAALVAKKDGVLTGQDWARCAFKETLKFPFLPGFTTTNPQPTGGLRGVRLRKGDVVLERVSKQAIFRLPESLRPEKTYAFRCR